MSKHGPNNGGLSILCARRLRNQIDIYFSNNIALSIRERDANQSNAVFLLFFIIVYIVFISCVLYIFLIVVFLFLYVFNSCVFEWRFYFTGYLFFWINPKSDNMRSGYHNPKIFHSKKCPPLLTYLTPKTTHHSSHISLPKVHVLLGACML